MRTRGRGRDGMRVGTSKSFAGHTIVSIADSAGNLLVTTRGPHGLPTVPLINLGIRIEGSSVSGYNTSQAITSTPSPTTFVTDGTYTADATGGRYIQDHAYDAAHL